MKIYFNINKSLALSHVQTISLSEPCTFSVLIILERNFKAEKTEYFSSLTHNTFFTVNFKEYLEK